MISNPQVKNVPSNPVSLRKRWLATTTIGLSHSFGTTVEIWKSGKTTLAYVMLQSRNPVLWFEWFFEFYNHQHAHFFFSGPQMWSPPMSKGLLPLILHTDGAEFYTNTEFIVWSFQSAFATGDIWDTKFPICIISHECLRDKDIKLKTQEKIAAIVSWSLKFAAAGLWPTHGPEGEEFLGGDRKTFAGKQLAGGYRACYFGFRADAKARKEANNFQRSYQHALICESCLAQRQHNDWMPQLNYKNFYPSAAHLMTKISSFDFNFGLNNVFVKRYIYSQDMKQLKRMTWKDQLSSFHENYKINSKINAIQMFEEHVWYTNLAGHDDYLRCDSQLSPWRWVDGWHLSTAFHDPMHVMFLGTCRDLYGSCLGYWLRNKYYDAQGSLADMLLKFSNDLRDQSQQQQILSLSFSSWQLEFETCVATLRSL